MMARGEYEICFPKFSISEGKCLCQNISPRFFKHGQAPAGVGGARRRHGMEGDIPALHELFIVALERLRGLAAIEADGPDFWIVL